MSIIRSFVKKTPLEYSNRLSEIYNNHIYLKREDQQITRSFKIRGVMNKILKHFDRSKEQGIICASTGNHAQAIAYCCHNLGINGSVVIPRNTPKQKISMIKYYGKDNIDILKYSNNFQDSLYKAYDYSRMKNMFFIHPFNDIDIIEGQGTIGEEILSEINPDYVFSCVGGGGLVAGIYNTLKNDTRVVGIEPMGSRSMTMALNNKKPYMMKKIDRFVDGAAVSRVGNINFDIIKNNVDIHTVTNEEVCKELVDLYNYEGIISEPAGVLSIAGLGKLKKVRDKKIVCIVSGGNNDMGRYPEILDFYRSYTKSNI
jgi:threonine dehydratase